MRTKTGPFPVFNTIAKVAQTTTIWSSSYGLAEGSLELALGGDISRAFSFEIAAE